MAGSFFRHKKNQQNCWGSKVVPVGGLLLASVPRPKVTGFESNERQITL